MALFLIPLFHRIMGTEKVVIPKISYFKLPRTRLKPSYFFCDQPLDPSMNTSFSAVEYEDASPELKAIYDETMQLMGTPFVLNWFKCQGNDPFLLRGNWEKIKGTMLTGQIPSLLKQLIYYNVSELRGCKYCAFIHKTTADGMGKELDASDEFFVTEDLESSLLPSSFKTAIRIISKCALESNTTTLEDFDELYDEGFSTEEVLELFAQADMINLLNTVADVSGIAIDSELLQAA